MTLKLGDNSRTTRRPEKLDEQLIGSTGRNAVETAAGLAGSPIASAIAAAAIPFLGSDAPSVPELAAEIAAHGVEDARDQVLKLYAPDAPAPMTKANDGKA